MIALTIRPYQAADRPHLIQLLRLNTPTYFAPEEEQDLEVYFDQHLEYYFVAEAAGEILGCAGINTTEDPAVVRLSWDMVHPDYQGQGVGSALTRYRMEQIQKMQNVRTVVVRTSQLAYPFYERFGFLLREVVRDYWAPGFDLYYMEYPVKADQP